MTARRANRAKVATLHAVAEAAGVSVATVSKALNGITVSRENYVKVHAAADALGYVPNEAARAMRGGRTSTIGLVVHLDVNPRTELMAILNTQIRDLEQRGYSVLISVIGGDADGDPLLRRLLERRVDALVYWNALEAPSLAGFRRAGIPVVAVGYRDEGCADIPLISVDGGKVFSEVYRRMKKLGHRHAAEINPGQTGEMHAEASRRFGIHFENRSIGFDDESVRRFVVSLRAEPDPPTVLFASYANAVQILAACEAEGVRVPDDTSVVGMTDSDAAALLRIPLSAFRTDYERLGHAISTAVFDALDGKQIGDLVVPDCITWVERSSLGPAAVRSSST